MAGRRKLAMHKVKPKYNVLDGSEIERIHSTALDILQKIGVRIKSEKILNFVESAGAEVEHTSEIAKFPSSLVMGYLESVPRDIKLYGTKDQFTIDVTAGGRRVYFGTGGAVSKILDLDSGECRKPILEDLVNLARLVDKLENVDFFLRPIVASDLHGEQLDVNKAYTAFSNTYKHIMLGVWTAIGAQKIIDMAAIIAGGKENLRKKPLLSFISTPVISPLQFNVTQFPIIEAVVKEGIPFAIGANPVTGSTGPITLAGSVAQTHAECLFCIVLAEMIHRGAPVLYLPLVSTSDMQTMNYLEGGIESGMMMAACVQLAHHLNLPIVSDAGCTDSKIPDAQAAYEKMANILQTALAGGSLIHHSAGMLESMGAVAFEQYVIDNEINGMVLRVLQGIEVTDDSLAFEAINSVAPGGTFMTEDHTIKHLRTKEFFKPKVADRNTREMWENEGRLDARERAKMIAKDILRKHYPRPISEQVDGAIRKRFDILI
jgi:trimethylamine--corrinoid protein Co-methyltransferase